MCLLLIHVYEKDALVSDKVFSHAAPLLSVQKDLPVPLPGTFGERTVQVLFLMLSKSLSFSFVIFLSVYNRHFY